MNPLQANSQATVQDESSGRDMSDTAAATTGNTADHNGDYDTPDELVVNTLEKANSSTVDTDAEEKAAAGKPESPDCDALQTVAAAAEELAGADASANTQQNGAADPESDDEDPELFEARWLAEKRAEH